MHMYQARLRISRSSGGNLCEACRECIPVRMAALTARPWTTLVCTDFSVAWRYIVIANKYCTEHDCFSRIYVVGIIMSERSRSQRTDFQARATEHVSVTETDCAPVECLSFGHALMCGRGIVTIHHIGGHCEYDVEQS